MAIKNSRESTMKKKLLAFALCTGAYAALFAYSVNSEQKTDTSEMTDVSRLMPVKIKQTVKGRGNAH